MKRVQRKGLMARRLGPPGPGAAADWIAVWSPSLTSSGLMYAAIHPTLEPGPPRLVGLIGTQEVAVQVSISVGDSLRVGPYAIVFASRVVPPETPRTLTRMGFGLPVARSADEILARERAQIGDRSEVMSMEGGIEIGGRRFVASLKQSDMLAGASVTLLDHNLRLFVTTNVDLFGRQPVQLKPIENCADLIVN
jgi:hypothetical protein